VCHQNNVTIPHFNVNDVLDFLLELKYNMPPKERNKFIKIIVKALNLKKDQFKPADDLSGGNKRKLCVATSLLTGSEIIFLDEPSTGMDPEARRSLWALLRAVRSISQCAIVLTTHSMEEAERVCSKIGIMVKGELKCIGSIQHLKQRFAATYTLSIQAKDTEDITEIDNFVVTNFKEARLIDEIGQTLTFSVKLEDKLSRIFELLQNNKEKLGIESFSLSQSSIEQVFMHFAKQQETESDGPQPKLSSIPGNSSGTLGGTAPVGRARKTSKGEKDEDAILLQDDDDMDSDLDE